MIICDKNLKARRDVDIIEIINYATVWLVRFGSRINQIILRETFTPWMEKYFYVSGNNIWPLLDSFLNLKIWVCCWISFMENDLIWRNQLQYFLDIHKKVRNLHIDWSYGNVYPFYNKRISEQSRLWTSTISNCWILVMFIYIYYLHIYWQAIANSKLPPTLTFLT